MRTLRDSANRLSAAGTPDGLLALAAELGFAPAALPVDDASRRRLGLPAEIADAQLVHGSGALRALLVRVPSDQPMRAIISRVAAGLSARTRHTLWVVLATDGDAGGVAIACWSPSARGTHVVALHAQRSRVLPSDAEVLCALAACREGEDLLVHTRWCELLGREALSRRFYRILEQRVGGLAESLGRGGPSQRAELALIYVSRLLFLSFLEAKGWLDGDRAFLANRFDDCMASGGHFHQRVLLPLFFGTLNTPARRRSPTARALGAIPFLNGGLFAKSALERRYASSRFSDEALGSLFGELLGAHRFTAQEGQEDWSEATIDPEMLGRAFESLMAAGERRVSGAFYTPQPLVSHVVSRALVTALSGPELSEEIVTSALTGGQLAPQNRQLLAQRLTKFTVLDPACGSGAFLVHILERLAQLHFAVGDSRSVAVVRREVLARAIHGVDVNPMAVWLCELRLWLSVVIESTETRMSAIPPLPNLDCNVRIGDALAGEAFIEPPVLVGPSAVLAKLRDRYVRASGPRKAPLRKALAREERRRALASIDAAIASVTHSRRERLIARQAADLFGQRSSATADERSLMRGERLRAAALRRERRRIADGGALPFSFPSHFGHAHARGGFGLVIGNPPWVRLHNIPASSRAALRERYTVFRDAAWDSGMRSAHAGRGFSSQVDLASLFVERSVDLASREGCIALLLPSKLWRSLAGGGVRRLLALRARVRLAEDWSDAPVSFDAAVYPSVLIASRQLPETDVQFGIRRATLDLNWQAPAASVRLIRDDDASPWLILPPDVRVAFNRVVQRGLPLADSALGRAMLGVKCGCNDAFMVNAVGEDGDVVTVEARGRRGTIEREALRPLLRGESVSPWRITSRGSAILWTHEVMGAPLSVLPPRAARWLAPWRRQLMGRTDLRGTRTWWALFRTESADHSCARVVWSDFGRVPRAAVLPAGDPTVPLNTCYVVRCIDHIDALTLCTLLNSPLAAAWLNAVAEPARGGWHRYLAWTVSLLPLPRDWDRARTVLAPLAERALLGAPPTSDELLVASCAAYRLRVTDVAPLIAWCHRPSIA